MTNNNSKSDWHLPSKDELNELCKYARNTGQAAGGAVLCVGGSLRAGFAAWRYWSSSESELPAIAWYQWFNSGGQTDNNKTFTSNVRPVRAFGEASTLSKAQRPAQRTGDHSTAMC